MNSNRLINAIANVAGFKTLILRSLNTKDIYSLRKAVGPVLALTDMERFRYCSLYSAIGVSTDWVLDMNKRGFAVVVMGTGLLKILRWITGSRNACRDRHTASAIHTAPVVKIMCVTMSKSTFHDEYDSRTSIRHTDVLGIPEGEECEYWLMAWGPRDTFRLSTPPLSNMVVNLDGCGMRYGLMIENEVQGTVLPIGVLDSELDRLIETRDRGTCYTGMMGTSRYRTMYMWTDMSMEKPEVGRMRWTSSVCMATLDCSCQTFVRDTARLLLSTRYDKSIYEWSTILLWEPNVSLVQVGDKVFSTAVDWSTGIFDESSHQRQRNNRHDSVHPQGQVQFRVYVLYGSTPNAGFLVEW
ncbi:hypothetical protein sscle_11g081590 [Sclerotinia sclerotiorum 1980 UF-70]|uniref:Uncharacterized protein n=1 Tax=Sclerotinia sclerotiorum (strain ATCC 18683 / 1980 / Ss-1) TaxID=665079 RepID=A0A1D9QES6_SCLS1|nr:hypothetical protein sscle_11g081590 [Sclerotinia sclerotiorum 1980 UF-70]